MKYYLEESREDAYRRENHLDYKHDVQNLFSEILNNVSDDLYLVFDNDLSLGSKGDSPEWYGWEFIGREDDAEAKLYKNEAGNIGVYFENLDNPRFCGEAWMSNMLIIYNDKKPAVFNFADKESIEEYVVKI